MGSADTHHPPVVVRPAERRDIDQIVQIETLSFAHAGERFNEAKVRYLLGSRRMFVAVAEGEGRVLGWVAGFVWRRTAEPWGRIYALAVHPDARRRRVGSRLLHHAIEELRRRGARRIFLEARAENHSAVAAYRKLGFVPCRELADYYGRGLHAHRMVLSS